MMLGAVLNPINSSMIAVALVPIGVAFGAAASETTWLVTALYIATSVGQPLVGRMVDQYGPKAVFLAGSALTGTAGLLGSGAPNLAVLVAARVILGFGTCAGFPSAMALIRRVSDRRGIQSPAAILTVLSVTVQTIAVIGPLLGGLLVEVGGWRATLAVNVPLAALCLVLGWWLLPRDDHGGAAGHGAIDWAGAALFSAALVGVLLFVMTPGLATIGWLAAGIACGVGFWVRELRASTPFIDVRVLGGNLPLLATYGRAFAASFVSYAFMYGFTQWLEQGRGLSPSVAGLVLLPTFGVGIVVAAILGRRPRVRVLLIIGGAIQILVAAALSIVASSSPLWLLVSIAALLGAPQGLLSLCNQNALYHQADAASLGASSGLLRTFQYVGAIAASASSGLAFGSSATAAGMHVLALMMGVVAISAFVLTVIDRSLARLPDGR